MSKKEPCENCNNGTFTCTTIKVQSLKTSEDFANYERKLFSLEEDYIFDSTDDANARED